MSNLPLSTILILGFWTVTTVWYLLFLSCLRQCGICCFWALTTVWYLLLLSYYDSVVFVVFELLRQCGICCFWTILTVCCLLFLSCYDSVVFVVFELSRHFVVFQFIISERPHHRRIIYVDIYSFRSTWYFFRF